MRESKDCGLFHNFPLTVGEFGVARRLSSLIETGGLQAVLLGPSWACELLLREGYDTFLSFSHLMSREAHHKQMIIFIPFQSAESLMYESAGLGLGLGLFVFAAAAQL